MKLQMMQTNRSLMQSLSMLAVRKSCSVLSETLHLPQLHLSRSANGDFLYAIPNSSIADLVTKLNSIMLTWH